MSYWKGHGPDVEVLHAAAGVSGPGSAHVSGDLTYEPYYGLKTKPFSLSTDPRPLYKSEPHAAVLQELIAAIRRREGVIALAGEMGTGKTTLVRSALYELDRKTFTTFVPDPFLTREDLLRMLLVGFGEVSVPELKQGQLKGVPRADLGCQLYEFLTSLESVDAFAVLVIEEAQHLSAPLVDEIRALSDLEAGRRLLQIVLVGQPDLRARLKSPDMRQLAQRVTTICELQPLTRVDAGRYVSHRLALAGGVRERVEFSSTALDLVFAASSGVPRLINRVCDRALFYGYLDRAPLIGQIHIRRALLDLDLWGPQPLLTATDAGSASDAGAGPSPAAAAPSADASPGVMTSGGLFAKKTASEAPSPSAEDLTALLELPPVARHVAEPYAASRTDRSDGGRSRRPSRHGWWAGALRSLWIPGLGMIVMLLTGGAAVATVGAHALGIDLPAAPPSPLLVAEASRPAPPSAAEPALEAAASRAAGNPQPAWVVQVAAFTSADRAIAMVRQLSDAGLPAYRVDSEAGGRGRLNIVRVGPYPSASDADAVRDRLRVTPEYEDAFVRNDSAR